MNLSTTYMGLKLRTPLVPSASPLSEKTENFRKMEDAGASAVVLYSLFEEPSRFNRDTLNYYFNRELEDFLDPFPEREGAQTQQAEYYLDNIAKAKAAVQIPIIASLNGTSPEGWIKYAKAIEGAGADALELNIYSIPTDMNLSSDAIEQEYLDIVHSVKQVITIPLAIKLTPYFSNMANMAAKLDRAGANALVLFNRFYQPDIELETQLHTPNVLLSTPQAMRLPLWWTSILRDRVNASLAASGGIQNGFSALKLIMSGADVVMLCSVLLQKGIPFLTTIERQIENWMEEHDFESLDEIRGSMSHKSCHSEEFCREHYMKVMQSYHAAV
jgi:dihydroorotate dehydrogenase (fumarate)